MASDFPIPETKVLAIASHVIYGYVGNTMATFVMQALGCEVSALNTVHFSNHTGYRHWRGTRSSAAEIHSIYQGLRENELVDFDVLLSGYAPGADAVEAVGEIGRDLKARAKAKGDEAGFLWVLDPVMGDNGKLYVSEDVVPAYKTLVRDADLILPNQFEAEVLSDVKIDSPSSLEAAFKTLHSRYGVPHIIITSIRFPPATASSSSNASSSSSSAASTTPPKAVLTVAGSSRRSDGSPRAFRIEVPDIDCFFSGTGDMFAALTVVRFREAVCATTASSLSSPQLSSTDHHSSQTSSALPKKVPSSWLPPPDDFGALDLPLARAVEKVLASMVKILEITKEERDREVVAATATEGTTTTTTKTTQNRDEKLGEEEEEEKDDKAKEEAQQQQQRSAYLRATKAAEVRVVRNAHWLRDAEVVYRAQGLG